MASPRERVRSKPQILRGCEADPVRHGQGGWARRRASAGREVGPLPERRLSSCPGSAPRRGPQSLPLSGRPPSRAPEGGARRGPLPRLTSRTLPGPGAPDGPGRAWLGARAARRRGRRRSVHPRLHGSHARQTPAAAFQGASQEAGTGLWGADQLPGTRGPDLKDQNPGPLRFPALFSLGSWALDLSC